MDTTKTDDLSINFYAARQPIFDADKVVRAYELLYRSSADSTSADFSDDYQATLHVMAHAIFTTGDKEEWGRIFVNYSKQAVLENVPLTFPSSSIIKVKESLAQDKSALKQIKKFSNSNYMIAVDGYSAQSSCTELYSLADIIIVDFLKPVKDLETLVHAARELDGTVMAKRVEGHGDFEHAKHLGAELFQGYFFHKPEMIPGRRFTTSECSRLNLLKYIREDENFGKLADAIQMDPALTHRMLVYINSPYFGLSSRITSVRHAISLLGWNKVRNLLHMVILTDASSPVSNELFITSATRATFLKMVATEHPEIPRSPDELYIMGLLSLLDAIFQVPMKDVVSNIALDKDIEEMLVTSQGPLYSWIELAKAFENGAWQHADGVIGRLELDFVKVSKSYYEAMKWVNSFYGKLT